MTVYVRWYGKVLEGELLEGESIGMKQVRIPLDGHHPIALFSPGHICDSPEQANEKILTISRKSAEISEKAPIVSQNEPIISSKQAEISPKDILISKDNHIIEAFKQANWDHDHNHLRTDKLDEFYLLWRKVMVPSGFVEAEATVTLSLHKPDPVFSEGVTQNDTPINQPQSHKPAIQAPSKKMLRSAGQQQFADSTQLALFD